MLQSFEAIYDHGRIQWIGDRPQTEAARVIVTLLDAPLPAPPVARRAPSAALRGSVTMADDLIAPAASDDDWDALR